MAGASYRVECEWPPEVRAFYPVLGATNAAAAALSREWDAAMRELLAPDSKAASLMSAEEFATAPLRYETDDIADAHLRSWVEDLFDRFTEISSRLRALLDASKRAFDIYTLATQTGGASWLTVEQLLFREEYDAQQARYDPSHKPLTEWRDKVVAAMTACEQSASLSKDGNIMGPVAPAVTRLLRRDHGTSRGRGGRIVAHEAFRHRTTTRRGSSGRPLTRTPLGKRTAGAGRGRGRPYSATKASSARKADAGSGKPAEGAKP